MWNGVYENCTSLKTLIRYRSMSLNLLVCKSAPSDCSVPCSSCKTQCARRLLRSQQSLSVASLLERCSDEMNTWSKPKTTLEVSRCSSPRLSLLDQHKRCWWWAEGERRMMYLGRFLIQKILQKCLAMYPISINEALNQFILLHQSFISVVTLICLKLLWSCIVISKCLAST